MAEYLIQDNTLTSIGNEVRTLRGSSSKMTPATMTSNLKTANTTVNNQTTIMNQILTALDTKGDGGLNFKVVGGTSQPSNPVENTIWVNTSTTISGWEFSATQPVASSGKVWIYVGTASFAEFNMLKENTAKMYPIYAKQYISGAWVNKTAKIWQGGKWVDLATYLFRAGDGAKVELVNNSESNGVINITSDYIEISNKGSTYSRAIVTTKDKISTAGMSVLVAEVILTEITNSSYPFALCVTNKPYAIGTYDIATYSELKTTGSNMQTVQVDLSSITSGTYYIAMTGAIKAKILNLYMM